MKIQNPIKVAAEAGARRRARAKLEICAVPVNLTPSSLSVLDQFMKDSGLSAKAVLGHALQQATQDGVLSAVAALPRAHLERIREVLADSQQPKASASQAQRMEGTI